MAQTVFITGCSTGIGEASARLFANHGWQVAAIMRNSADSWLAALPSVRAYALDVTDETAMQHMVEQAHQEFGSLTVVVNNAGYGMFGPFEPASTTLIKRQFQTNAFGAFAVIRPALPNFRAQHFRRHHQHYLRGRPGGVSAQRGLLRYRRVELRARPSGEAGDREKFFYEKEPG